MAEDQNVVEVQAIPFDAPTDRYTVLHDAYYGTGGFEDGSYLMPHIRETPDKYERRKKMAYYTNYVSTIVKGVVAPIFRNEAVRDWKGGDLLFDTFMKDVDQGGRSMKKFMRKAAQLAKLYGVALIMVDNVSQVPDNKEDAQKQRALPYCYIVLPKQVQEYEITKTGRVKKLVYTVSSTQFSAGMRSEKTETWTWTETSWSVEGGDYKEKIETPHTLGCVPVVPLFGTEPEDGDLLPISECFQMAKINMSIFNVCSELRELLRNQCFSVLAYPFTEKLSVEQLKELIVGTEDMLPFDGDKNPPVFISPEASCAQTLQEELQRLVTEMYRMAAMSSVTGVEEQASGVAKAWDFEQTNQTISDLADNCEDAEKRIVYIFNKWQNSNVEYECKYPDDFGIVDIMAELDIITKALSLAVGGLFDEELKKRAADMLFKDIDEADYNAIVQDIEQTTQFDIQNRAFQAEAEKAQLQETIKNPGGTPAEQ